MDCMVIPSRYVQKCAKTTQSVWICWHTFCPYSSLSSTFLVWEFTPYTDHATRTRSRHFCRYVTRATYPGKGYPRFRPGYVTHVAGYPCFVRSWQCQKWRISRVPPHKVWLDRRVSFWQSSNFSRDFTSCHTWSDLSPSGEKWSFSMWTI